MELIKIVLKCNETICRGYYLNKQKTFHNWMVETNHNWQILLILTARMLFPQFGWNEQLKRLGDNSEAIVMMMMMMMMVNIH